MFAYLHNYPTNTTTATSPTDNCLCCKCGLSAQRDHGGEAGRASPPPADAVPPRGRGHHGAAVGRHLQVPARHELLIVEENEIAQVIYDHDRGLYYP